MSMSCHSILLSSLMLNPEHSQSDNIYTSVLVTTMHCATLPEQAMQGVMMAHFQMRRLAVRHQRAMNRMKLVDVKWQTSK